MKITILGTRGEIQESAPYHSKKSGVLINDTLLLDCGDKRFLTYDPKYILITHLHPDHAYFVRSSEQYNSSTPLYAPEKYKSLTINITTKPFILDKYRITPITTIHSVKVKSNAYLIQKSGQKILYTGDMIWIRKKDQRLLKNLDAVITEASFMHKGGVIRRKKETGEIFGHTGIPNLINLFKKYTKTIIFVHFGAWFYKNMPKARKKFAQLAQENNIEIIVGYDGLQIEL